MPSECPGSLERVAASIERRGICPQPETEQPQLVTDGGQSPDDDSTHYITAGTWLRDRTDSSLHTLGVVVDVLDIHDSGTLKIRWYPNACELISVRMLVASLRTGSYAIDDGSQLHTGGGCGVN